MSINDKLSSWDPPVPPWKMEVMLKKQTLLNHTTKRPTVDFLNTDSQNSAVHPHSGLHASEVKHKDWEALRSKPGTRYLDSSSLGIQSEQESEECIKTCDIGGKGTSHTSVTNCWKKNRMGEEKYLDIKRAQLESVPSPSFSSFSDGFAYEQNEELEYGPGIVNRLRSRFINWSKENKESQPVRRVASLEHIAPECVDGGFTSRFKKSPRSACGDRRSFPFSGTKRTDVLKKARSMETLSSTETSFGIPKLKPVDKLEIPSLLINENVIIIDQPKESLKPDFAKSQEFYKRIPSVEENELPKPDTVRTVKKLFESEICKEKKNFHRKDVLAKSIPVLKSFHNTTANNFINEGAKLEEEKKVDEIKNDKMESEPNKNIPPKITQVIVNSSTEAEDQNDNEDQMEALLKPCNVLPRVVSIKQKSDDKPIGLIRPLSVSATGDEKENLINKAKSACVNNVGNNIIENNTSEDLSQRIPLRKTGASPDTENSVIFNFTSKPNVTPKIRNTESSFSVVRPIIRIDKISGKLISNIHKDGTSGIILVPGCNTTSSQDYSDDEDSSTTIPYPSGIVFEGENVSLNKTCFLSRRNKQLKISFKDNSVETYEYPSEEVMLANFLEANGDDCTADLDNNQLNSPSVNNIPQHTNDLNTNLSNNLGDLANYVPSQLSNEKFELGVSPLEPPPPLKPKQTEPVVVEEDSSIKPANDDEASSWSTSQFNGSDLLF